MVAPIIEKMVENSLKLFGHVCRFYCKESRSDGEESSQTTRG